MGELIDDIEHTVLAAVIGAVLYEVVRPDVIGPFRPKSDAEAVSEPKATPFGLFLWDL